MPWHKECDNCRHLVENPDEIFETDYFVDYDVLVQYHKRVAYCRAFDCLIFTDGEVVLSPKCSRFEPKESREGDESR